MPLGDVGVEQKPPGRVPLVDEPHRRARLGAERRTAGAEGENAGELSIDAKAGQAFVGGVGTGHAVSFSQVIAVATGCHAVC
ncbi:hypothetical protein ACIBAG_28975 [Streptomyces sp. NPDC051243]|uniref:hypothetical protein n=1 Tax=Streptomyces sp. NPDC051243 TaxID=3365646 RepID=UPI0037931F02